MLYRKICQVVSNPNSLFKVKFSGNLSESALTSLLLLCRLERSELESSLENFRSSLFSDLKTLPNTLTPLLSKEKKEDFSEPYQDLFAKLTHIQEDIQHTKSLSIGPNEVSEALKVIYEFVDKAKVGFLSGDYTLELIDKLVNHIGMLEKSSIEENHDFFKKVEEYIRDQEFCLPKHGIPFPLKENPQAMYIREAFIERDSPEIIMKALKNDTEVLTHSAFSLNYLTPKEHLIELHANLCSNIRKEQANCLQKSNKSFSKSYADVLVMNK